MGKVVVSEFMTLDGVMEAPEKWQFPYWNDETEKFKNAEYVACDAMLLGRVTFQMFAEAWPTITDDTGFADRMNSMPKFVASTTLKEPLEWNATLIKGDLAQEIGKLKKQNKQDLLIAGGAGLVHSLMKLGLIDEYRLLVYPIVLGSGKRLFIEGGGATLKLVDSKPMGSGVLLLTYQPGPKPAQ